MFNREPVESSFIESIGYNHMIGKLEVEFSGNRVYQYKDVPESVYKDLMEAPSHGKFFHKYIKDEYKFKQV